MGELSQREERKRGREVTHRGEESSSRNSLNPLVSNSPLGVSLYRWRDETHLIQLAI
jgi:hypothetical protein